MAPELPNPDTATEQYLAAILERLDAVLAALVPEPTPAPRKRAPRKTT